MTAAQKFTFDLDFARKPPRNKVLPEDEFEQLIAAARAEGHRQGLAEGQASAEARASDALAKAAEKLAAQTVQMSQAMDAQFRQHLAESVGLAASVGRKLAAHLIARHPEAELAALIAECLSSLDHAPHLVVRCHPDLCDAVRAITEERMKSSGFTGRLVIMGDPDIRLGDGRLEWVDGGLVRDLNAIANEINARISAYLTARGATETGE